MKKITNWIINNSLLGSLINVFLGDNWREERPKAAAVIYMFFAAIYIMAFVGFIIGLLSD